MLPLALQCRFTEALLMEKAIRLIERIPRIMPLAARVDGIYWTTECLDSAIELHELVAEERYSMSRRPVYNMKEPQSKNSCIILTTNISNLWAEGHTK